MNDDIVSALSTPILAAYQHVIVASSRLGEEREEEIGLVITSLRNACDNAGYDMVKRS